MKNPGAFSELATGEDLSRLDLILKILEQMEVP